MPSTEITDNHLSDALDVLPYRDQAIMFNAVNSALLKYLADDGDNIGVVRAVLPAFGSDDTATTWTFYVLTYKAGAWRILKVEYTGTVDTITTFSCTATATNGTPSACIFTTEAETYYCFTFDSSDRLHYIRSTAGTYGYIDLPFSPKKIIAHASRVFAIGEPNKLWWCRAGDLFSWYGSEYDNDAVSTSQTLGNKAFTITTQPNTTRLITFTHTKTDTLDTLGSIALVGLDYAGVSQTETITLVDSTRVISSKYYSSITSATMSGWTQGGATPDTLLIGTGPVGSKYVQADAGYWTVEKELELIDMCVLSGDLYLFAPHNIYVFQGYSYDTFSLQHMIADVGIREVPNKLGHRNLTVVENLAYFRYGNDIYSFDGNSQPRIISRPIIVNGQSTNGIAGGIPAVGSYWALASDNEYVYLYQSDQTPDGHYRYSQETKTWWYFSGVTKTDVGTAENINTLFVPSYSKAMMFNFVSINSATVPTWFFTTELSVTQSTTYPYVITKAFNTSPSEDGTLTALILQLKGTNAATANITVSYQTTDSGTTFTTIKAYSAQAFTGDTEIFEIPLLGSSIHRQHHYRIKIIIQSATYPVYLYNIERRFRVVGRSR